MTKSSRAHSRKGAQGAGRNRPYRRGRRDRRPSWVAPLQRLNYALASTVRLIESAHLAVDRAWDTCVDAPVRTSRDLHRATVRLRGATIRLTRASVRLSETCKCIGVESERAEQAPALLIDAGQRWDAIAELLEEAFEQTAYMQAGVIEGLRIGELVPERTEPAARRRPRIILAPRTISAREFLLFRRSSARSRIASVPTPRRRARIAAVDAPRRISRGRAPPPASTCTL